MENGSILSFKLSTKLFRSINQSTVQLCISWAAKANTYSSEHISLQFSDSPFSSCFKPEQWSFFFCLYAGKGLTPLMTVFPSLPLQGYLAQRGWCNCHDWSETQISWGDRVWRTHVCCRNSSGKEKKCRSLFAFLKKIARCILFTQALTGGQNWKCCKEWGYVWMEISHQQCSSGLNPEASSVQCIYKWFGCRSWMHH